MDQAEFMASVASNVDRVGWALQGVFPAGETDPQGRVPWQSMFDADWADMQPLLGSVPREFNELRVSPL